MTAPATRILMGLLLLLSYTTVAQNISIPAHFDWTRIPPDYAGKTLEINHHHRATDSRITLPNHTTLRFKGGSLTGFNMLTGENITIIAPKSQIFEPKTNINGLFINTMACPEWFGAKGDNQTNDAAAVLAAIYTFPKVLFSAEYYIPGALITILNARELTGEKNALLRGDGGDKGRFTIKNTLSVQNIRFEGFRFCFLFDHDQNIEGVKFVNNHFSQIEKPIYASNNNLKQKLLYIEITGNTFQHCSAGVELLSWLRFVTLCHNQFIDLGNKNLESQANAVRLGNTAFQNHKDTAMGDFTICGNEIRNVFCGMNPNNQEGYECHGIFAVGNRITIQNNQIEEVYNGGSRNNPRIKTGSEGIYVKANHCRIQGNTLINAGFGEGSICVKGFNTDVEIVSNTIRYTANLADQSQLITCYYTGNLLIKGNAFESVATNTTGIKLCNAGQHPSEAIISDNILWRVNGYGLKILNLVPGSSVMVSDNQNISILGDLLKEESTKPYNLHFNNNVLEVKDGLFLPSSKINRLTFNGNVVVAQGKGKINNLYNGAKVENNKFSVSSSFPNNPLFISQQKSIFRNNKTTFTGQWREELMIIED